MRKLVRSRKAVSPVVSAVLMMLVAIIGMSVLFAGFVNYTRDYQTGIGSAVLESMVIEDVWFESTTAEVWVYNIGKLSFTINSVYVDDQKIADYRIAIEPSSEIAPGKHGKVSITSASPGRIIKIVTDRGSAFEGGFS